MKPNNTEKHVKQAETIISKPRTHDTEGESAFLTKKKTHIWSALFTTFPGLTGLWIFLILQQPILIESLS